MSRIRRPLANFWLRSWQGQDRLKAGLCFTDRDQAIRSAKVEYSPGNRRCGVTWLAHAVLRQQPELGSCLDHVDDSIFGGAENLAIHRHQRSIDSGIRAR